MFLKLSGSKIAALVFICLTASFCDAQQPAPSPSPQSAPVEKEEQAPVKVFTEEVVLPVVAFDSEGRFDPTVEPDDILILEDNVPQKVKSVRHIPANILLVLDLGSQITALTKSTNATRDLALKLVNVLPPGDSVAIIQNSNRVELLQDWTTNAKEAEHTLKNRFFAGNDSRLSECLLEAVDKLKEKPNGNNHIVLITEGVETKSSQQKYESAVRQLASSGATLHVISYSAVDTQSIKERNSFKNQLPSIDIDFKMKRWFRNYAEAMRMNDERLRELVKETGGKMSEPASVAEVAETGNEVSHEIDAQYIITYAPKRLFADSPGKEQRRIRVASRRVGLQLIAMRDHVAVQTQ